MCKIQNFILRSPVPKKRPPQTQQTTDGRSPWDFSTDLEEKYFPGYNMRFKLLQFMDLDRDDWWMITYISSVEAKNIHSMWWVGGLLLH